MDPASPKALGVLAPVQLVVTHRGRYEATVELHDLHPVTFEVAALPLEVRIAHGVSRYEYEVRPTRRGDADFGRIDCLIRSPLGLCTGLSKLQRHRPLCIARNRGPAGRNWCA